MHQASFFDADWKLDYAAGVISESETERTERVRTEYQAREREREDRRRREQSEREARERTREQSRRARPSHFTDDPWLTLGVGYGASKEELRQAWIRLIKLYHPDAGGDPAMFRRVQSAWERVR